MPHVVCGADQVGRGDLPVDPSTRVALLTNRSARSSSGEWVGEIVARQTNLILLLSPEHGLSVDAPAGARVPHARMGELPIWSLYGAATDGLEEAISAVDLLVVDLPDVGFRYYTYPWTMHTVLLLAARLGKPVWVLDRPNPVGGIRVEGGLPEAEYESAVCEVGLPVRHGLTLGERALWQVRTRDIDVDLSVVTMQGWKRTMTWDETGLIWVAPSPALPSAHAALLYGSTCLLEGTNLSEGRGTETPFEVLGAPFVDARGLVERLHADPSLVGLAMEETRFIPSRDKWSGEQCFGVRLRVVDPRALHPVRAGLAIISALLQIPGFAFRERHFDALAGTDRWRQALEAGADAATIAESWADDESRFQAERESMLLYD